MSVVDKALNAAVLLAGAERGHALLGCDWGSRISTADDPAACTRQARQLVVIHDAEEVLDLKLCWAHRARVMAETDPHRGAS